MVGVISIDRQLSTGRIRIARENAKKRQAAGKKKRIGKREYASRYRVKTPANANRCSNAQLLASGRTLRRVRAAEPSDWSVDRRTGLASRNTSLPRSGHGSVFVQVAAEDPAAGNDAGVTRRDASTVLENLLQLAVGPVDLEHLTGLGEIAILRFGVEAAVVLGHVQDVRVLILLAHSGLWQEA